MAYDQDTFNSMQLNLGLTPGGGAPPQLNVMPPAMAAQQMQAQASQQLAAGAAMTRLPAATPLGVFGQQFQNQFQMAQSQQSYNPYIAQALSGGGGYQQGMMPSPLMMTPPSTGMFRPPPQMQMSAIPPQQVAPFFQGGFTPQLPAPMFQTAWDRELQQREYRADKIYSMVAQTPRALGTAAGVGAGAFAGAKVGSMFGPLGGLAGMIGGGLAAGMSGFAGGVGDMAMIPMRPSMEIHGMGASLQRMSQQWVVAGPQLHQQGAGFTRSAAQDMATQIRSLASDRAFRTETGGQFNREDLMRMTETSGRAGLMDMDQSVDAVRTNLRQVARTVRRFMQLTGDPDVTSVIREMGQMRAYGMSVPEMERAAQNMKTFARAAGTSIQGLQAMGGMPGAMTYSGMGLSAGAGFEAGNYSLAAARQAVASGAFNIRELSMLGGVQGVAQRNVQAGAAMMSMPLFGAAIGSYGAQGWNVNYGNLAQAAGGGQGGLGAAGMVMGAVQNMGRAVAQGGVGALAEYQLRQRFMQDDAAHAMSPAMQTAMRFKMAQQTGQTLGFHGTAAFTAGARAMYGDEVAEQMLMEARNPESFRAQARMMRTQNQEISRRQREDIMNAAPGFTDVLGYKLGISPTGAGMGGFDQAGNALTNLGHAIWRDNPAVQFMQDRAARERGERIVRVSPMIAIENEKQRQGILKGIGRGDLRDTQNLRRNAGQLGRAGWVQSVDLLAMGAPALYNQLIQDQANAAGGMDAAGLAVGLTSGGVGFALGLGLGGAAQGIGSDFSNQIIMGHAVAGLSAQQYAKLQTTATTNARAQLAMIRGAQDFTPDKMTKLDVSLGKHFGKEGDAGKAALLINQAAAILAEKARGKLTLGGGAKSLGTMDVAASITEAGHNAGLSTSEIAEVLRDQSTRSAVWGTGERMGGSMTAGVFRASAESAGAVVGMVEGLTGKALQESLAKREANYETMMGWQGEGDTGAKLLRGKMREMAPTEYLAMMVGAGALSPKKQAEFYAQYLKRGGTKEGFAALLNKASVTAAITGLTPEEQAKLKAQGGAQSIGQITGMITNVKEQSEVGLETSGLAALGKMTGISGLEGLANAPEALIEKLGGAEQLDKLRAAGQGGLAKLIAQATRTKGTAQGKQFANQAMQAIAGMGDLTAGEKTETLAGAQGEQAAQNEASAKALEEVADSLKDAGFDKFKDGAADFVEGAAQLRKAMESETIKNILGQVKT